MLPFFLLACGAGFCAGTTAPAQTNQFLLMTGSLQIAKIFGIPVFLHWSFGLLFVYVLFSGLSRDLNAPQIIWFQLLTLATFCCVLLHEFGHALTARRYGVPTRDIVLYPIGGVARLEYMPQKPMQELVVAIAGPLVNIAIAILLSPVFYYAVSGIQERGFPANESDFIGDYFWFLPMLLIINVGLAIFNLIPAFPMDGGRVFRALLSSKLGRRKATRIATLLGQVLAVGMVVFGIWDTEQISFVLIGVFIFIAAARENRFVKQDDIWSRFTVRDIMQTDYAWLLETDPMRRALELAGSSRASHFLVMGENGEAIGTLSNEAIETAFREGDFGAPVSKYLQPGVQLLSPDDSLRQAGIKIQHTESEVFVVMENGAMVGIADSNSLYDFIALQEKMG